MMIMIVNIIVMIAVFSTSKHADILAVGLAAECCSGVGGLTPLNKGPSLLEPNTP